MKYLQIYETLKNDIENETYKFGKKLPSKRTVAEIYDVSVITVEHAYEMLMDEGYVEAREKSGYFVMYKTGDYFTGTKYQTSNKYKENKNNGLKKVELKPDSNTKQTEFFDEDKNDPYKDLKPLSFDIYAKTARKILSMYGEEVYEKSPSYGNIRLRKSISEYLKRSRHMHISEDQIIIGAGSEYLYKLIVSVFGIEKLYGLESPGYGKIKDVYERNFASTEELHLGKDGIESDELWNSKADIIHITPFRSYPTGVSASAGKKREYIEWSIKNNGIIVEDDFESEFSPLGKAEDTLFSMDEEGRVIYVNTFTRTISPSLRMGYMLIPENMKEMFYSNIGLFSCPVPTFEQLIVSLLIDNGDFERHINKTRRIIRSRQNSN